MHTQHDLQGEHFHWSGAAAGLDELLPARNASTRIVFVAPDPVGDMIDLAGLTLALAHAFYARPQAHAPGFYDYPSHFVVGGSAGAEPRLLNTAASEPWSRAWCALDVWPNTHHAVAEPTPFGLIQAVYMLEPDILVWPARLTLPDHYAPPADDVNPDQRDMESLLARRLQQVLLYEHAGTLNAEASTRVALTGAAADLGHRAVSLLPGSDAPPAERLAAAAFRTRSVQAFLHPQPSTA